MSELTLLALKQSCRESQNKIFLFLQSLHRTHA